MFRRVATAVGPAAASSSRAVWARRLAPTLGSRSELRRLLAVDAVAAAPGGSGGKFQAPLTSSGAGGAVAAAARVASLGEACAALRAAKGADGHVSPAEVLPLVERCHALAVEPSAHIEDLAELADTFVELRLRTPLRDMMPAVMRLLLSDAEGVGVGGARAPGPEALPSVMRLLSASGRGSLYHAELFEFCTRHVANMEAATLAAYLYEAGRHGLRARHFADAAMERATALAPQMSATDLMKSVQGLVRFATDWRVFFQAAQPRIMAVLDELSTAQLLLAMRVGRILRHVPGFIDLHAACCTRLLSQAGEMSLAQGAACLIGCTFSPKFRAQAHALVRGVEQAWTRQEDLSDLRVVEVVDALQTFASWGMRPQPLTNRLNDILVERQIELKYAGNVSLWVSATEALARMGHFEAKWPFVALEFSRDPAFVERVSFYQQSALICAFARLRILDEAVYDCGARLLLKDFGLFREARDLAPLLAAYASAGCLHEGLFDAAYDHVIGWLDAETLDMSRRNVQSAFIQIVWSFVVAGYHKRYESFAAFLDYVFFTKLVDSRPDGVRQLAQIADACLTEAPEIASLCQFPEQLAAARADMRVRRLVAAQPPAEPQFVQELRSTLQELGWPYEIFVVPDQTSAFYIDVSLEPHLKRKVGLLVAGRHELFRDGLPAEARPPREGGQLLLARRLHGAAAAAPAGAPATAARSWRTAVVRRDAWGALKSLEERRDFLEEAVRRALEEPQPVARAA